MKVGGNTGGNEWKGLKKKKKRWQKEKGRKEEKIKLKEKGGLCIICSLIKDERLHLLRKCTLHHFFLSSVLLFFLKNH